MKANAEMESKDFLLLDGIRVFCYRIEKSPDVKKYLDDWGVALAWEGVVRQKEAVCQMIDSLNGMVICLDGLVFRIDEKEDAKKYVVEYGDVV